jgi:iron(III) transport system ATP-binding protein
VSGLAITDLHKRFDTHPVLTGVDLVVPPGSLTAILGRSGSGKTTLLRLLAGFDAPDRGSVRIGGRVVDSDGVNVKPERRRIGYVPQEGALFPHLTVAGNVGFGLRRAARRAEVADLLDLVGLADVAGRYPHQLSGGQQQRVAVARALAVKPEVVLMDEPFAALDAGLRASVRDDVRHILRRASTTAILVTHDQDEALSIADLVAVLRDGRIAQCGTPQDVYTRPVDGDLARFLGDANLLTGVFDGELVETALGRLPAGWHTEPMPTPCPVTILIRPEAIRLGPAGARGVPGRVIRVDYHGHDAVAHVQTDGALLIVRSSGDARPAPGAEVALSARGPTRIWPARVAAVMAGGPQSGPAEAP